MLCRLSHRAATNPLIRHCRLKGLGSKQVTDLKTGRQREGEREQRKTRAKGGSDYLSTLSGRRSRNSCAVTAMGCK
jgi:hypothetical protein